MKILILSCSLHPESRSRLLAEAARECLNTRTDASCDLVDLRDFPLPHCDGDVAYAHPHVTDLSARIEGSDAILLATPIYNYDVNAAAKNVLELTGQAWTGKVVAFLCAAGGKSSYMSIMGFANSLMLDFRCLIIPRFVYAEGDAFTDDAVSDAGVRERLDEICERAVALAKATAHLTEPPAAFEEEV